MGRVKPPIAQGLVGLKEGGGRVRINLVIVGAPQN